MGYRQEDDEDQFGAPTDQATMGDMPDPAAQPSKVDVASYLKQKYGQAADMSGVQDARKKKAMADGIASIGEMALSHSTPGVTYLKGFNESGAPVRAGNVNSNIDMSALRQYGDTQVANAEKSRQAKIQANDMDNKFDEQGRQLVREDKQDARQDVQDKFSAEDQDQKRKGWDVTNRGNDQSSAAANQARLLLQSTLVQKSKAAREAGDSQAADTLMDQAKTAGQGMSANEIMGLHSQVKDLSYDDILNAKNKKAQLTYSHDMHQQAMDGKLDKESRTAATTLAGNLESYKGDAGAAQAAKNKLAVANAMSIINSVDDPNKLSSTQLAQLNAELGRIATGGVASEHAMGEMSADNLQSRAAKLQSFFTSAPTPANQAKFVEQSRQYLKELGANANDYINNRRRNLIMGNKSINENHRQELLDRYQLNAAPQDDAATPAMAPQATSTSQPTANKPTWAK